VTNKEASNVCVYARRWWAVKRDKRREGKGDINRTQVNGRASGVACNALLGGPGAAMELGYIVQVARRARLLPTAWRTAQKQRGARAIDGGAYTARRAAYDRAGAASSNAGAVGIWSGYTGAFLLRFVFGARRASLLRHRAAARVVSGAQREYRLVYAAGTSASRRGQTLHLAHRVPRVGVAPQWKICPAICRYICFSTPAHTPRAIRYKGIRGMGTAAQRLRLRAPLVECGARRGRVWEG